MNNDNAALESVLGDLAEFGREHPELCSILLRLLRQVRETFIDVAEQVPKAEGPFVTVSRFEP